jgi:ABC-type multidrug transport system permease subunit
MMQPNISGSKSTENSWIVQIVLYILFLLFFIVFLALCTKFYKLSKKYLFY